MTCTEFEELSGAYVLDAVTPEERKAAEAHLAQCPRCTQLVKELRSTVELLPLSLAPMAPPPQLKGRILSAVQAAATTSSQSKQNIGVMRPLQTFPSIPPMQQRQPAPPMRRSATQRWAMPLLAAAAVLFLLLSGGLATWNVSLQREVSILRANTVTTTTYAIKGTASAPGVNGEAVYFSSPSTNNTVMILHNLPNLTGQQVYQGWEIQGKQTKSVGLLNVQSDGTATISIAGDVKGNDAVAVSIENGPTATPNAPKGKVVAVGKVS